MAPVVRESGLGPRNSAFAKDQAMTTRRRIGVDTQRRHRATELSISGAPSDVPITVAQSQKRPVLVRKMIVRNF